MPLGRRVLSPARTLGLTIALALLAVLTLLAAARLFAREAVLTRWR